MSNKPVIIAEIGVNHNGSLTEAKKLIDNAIFAGADFVKFQAFKAKEITTISAPLADYQKKQIQEASQFAMLKKLELSNAELAELATYCEKKIGFLVSAFDLPSLDFVLSLKPKKIKIPSGEITNLPYLQKISACNLPVLLSTGMATLADIESALDILLKGGLKRHQITLLQCNTEYPTPAKDVNLKCIKTLKETFKTDVGFSDHTNGTIIPIAAVALGASVIEKHFTLNNDQKGPDHKASLSPLMFKKMVDDISEVASAMGDGIKKPSPSELKNISVARKSLVAKTAILKGEILTAENIAVKRPGRGISPMLFNDLIGRKACRDYMPDELIEW